MQLIRLGIKSVSLRTLLVAMITFAAVPLLGFGAILLDQYADVERDRASLQLSESARGIAQAIDSRFLAVKAVVTAMSGSPLIPQGRFQEWERRLRVVTARTGIPFQLYSAGGDLQANTVDNPGIRDAQVPIHLFSRLADGDSFVTNVLGSRENGSIHARVVVAVADDDGIIRWMLHGIVLPTHFQNIASFPGVPPNWVVSVVDRDGVHMMRNLHVDEYLGRPLVPVLAEQVRARHEVQMPTITHEGVSAISATAFAPLSGWAAAVGLPREDLQQPLRHSLLILAGTGVLLVGLAVLATVFVARYLVGTIADLGDLARRVGAGERVTAPPTAVTEIAQVGRELENVSQELHARARNVERLNDSLESQVATRTHELAEANVRLRNEMARREETEAQLRQIQKMEAIGRLTGGIAHDFNNMLAVIMSSLNLLKRRLARGDTDLGGLIESGIEGAEKAAVLTRGLLAFSRQQPLSPRPHDVNRLLAEMEPILRRTLPPIIEIEIVRAAGLWHTLIDAPALESAIINLMANARDAMPEGGKLTIETANTILDERYAAAHAEVTAGQYVMIAISDTGTGMPASVAENAFDPFFTTKPTGTGTGLGLSQVHGFIRQSGGHIKLYSEEGVGTTVKLYLPRTDTVVQGAPPAREQSTVPTQGHGERILVVEDEQEVRELVAQMLEELDYRVVEARDPHQALSILKEEPEFDLLLTDIIMPGMNGRALADLALEAHPDLKVLFITGYTRNAIIHNGVLDRGVHLLVKPFTLQSLSEKLAEVLEGGT